MIPVKSINAVYHVGTLDPADIGQFGSRGGTSHEGHHLSVSLHPEEWRRIARLGDSPVHTLHKEGGNFLLARKVEHNPEVWRQIREWGEKEQLVIPGVRWAAWMTDEDGDERYSLHASAAEAALEAWESMAQSLENEPDAQLAFDSQMAEVTTETESEFIMGINATLKDRRFVSRKTVILPTAQLEERTGIRISDDATQALIVAWAQSQGRRNSDGQPLDGVWWEDELAPEAYSAPRGLIFRECVAQWKAT